MKVDNQLIIAIATICISAGIAWGIAQNKLKSQEIRLAIVEGEHKSDHDVLIKIETKLDMLIQTIEKIQADMRRQRPSFLIAMPITSIAAVAATVSQPNQSPNLV